MIIFDVKVAFILYIFLPRRGGCCCGGGGGSGGGVNVFRDAVLVFLGGGKNVV